MKKYLFIYKTAIIDSLQYVFNIFTSFISYLLLVFIFINLWEYMYSNPDEVINGYTKAQMIWYVIITEILWMSLSGRAFCKSICDDVKGGNIAYNLNKPYSYILYSLFNHFGKRTIRFGCLLILGFSIGFLFLHQFPCLNVINLLLIFITMILAFIINSLFVIIIGLFSFVIEDANPFFWLYSKCILVLGTLFPVEYFPTYIQPIITYSPIYVTSAGPAKLFVDFSYTNFMQVLILQIGYVLIAYLLCSFCYRKGVLKLNVNGG